MGVSFELTMRRVHELTWSNPSLSLSMRPPLCVEA